MLLYIESIKMDPTTQDGKSKLPLYLEVSLKKAEGGPYLVTSSTGLLWRDQPLTLDPPMLRAALREISPAGLFASVLGAIIVASDSGELGPSVVVPTVHEAEEYFTKQGVVEYDTMKHATAPWLPKGVTHVLAPVKREQLGTAFLFEGTSRVAAVVQNISRAIRIVRP